MNDKEASDRSIFFKAAVPYRVGFLREIPSGRPLIWWNSPSARALYGITASVLPEARAEKIKNILIKQH